MMESRKVLNGLMKIMKIVGNKYQFYNHNIFNNKMIIKYKNIIV